MRWLGLSCVTLFAAAMPGVIPSVSATSHPAISAAITSALADPGRASQRGVDARRHPAELVALSGARPGQKVLDLIPGDGYWTRIFSKVVGARGHVYAVWPEGYAKVAASNVATLRAMSASPQYANVTAEVQHTTNLAAPEPLDVVWTSQNYHDYNDAFLGSPGPQALATAAYRLLKPGGVFVVIDHRAVSGHGLADTDTLHRIDPKTVREEAQAAGFVFAGESRVLENAKDRLTMKVFDPAIRGHTSQFAYKFVKPMSRARPRS